jgi:hypothetical protein
METMDKSALRREVRARLAVLDADEKRIRSQYICNEVKKHLAAISHIYTKLKTVEAIDNTLIHQPMGTHRMVQCFRCSLNFVD